MLRKPGGVSSILFVKCSGIGELHQKWKLAHLDIWLDNVCFNKQFELVFIDFDLCEVAYQRVVQNVSAQSCMIDPCKSTDQNDWRQLGWMILWASHPGNAYHNRKFEDLPKHLKDNKMLQQFIQECHFIDLDIKVQALLS